MSKHSGKLLLWVMFMLTFSLQALAVDASVRKSVKSVNHKENGITISGEYIEYVNIAFDDHTNIQKRGPSKEIRYYMFYIFEENGLIKIDISVNNDLLMKEKKMIAMGGDVEYSFKRGIKKIQDITVLGK